MAATDGLNGSLAFDPSLPHGGFDLYDDGTFNLIQPTASAGGWQPQRWHHGTGGTSLNYDKLATPSDSFETVDPGTDLPAQTPSYRAVVMGHQTYTPSQIEYGSMPGSQSPPSLLRPSSPSAKSDASWSSECQRDPTYADIGRRMQALLSSEEEACFTTVPLTKTQRFVVHGMAQAKGFKHETYNSGSGGRRQQITNRQSACWTTQATRNA